jgi:hypothetical protein
MTPRKRINKSMNFRKWISRIKSTRIKCTINLSLGSHAFSACSRRYEALASRGRTAIKSQVGQPKISFAWLQSRRRGVGKGWQKTLCGVGR